MKAAIIGLGTVGCALKTTLETHGFSAVGYDRRGDHDWNNVLACQAAFVCVDTPGLANGRLDAANVVDVVDRLNTDGYEGLIIVRSTMPIGLCRRLKRNGPARIVYMPEFLRARSALEWSLNPDRIVIGGEPKDLAQADYWFHWTEAPRIHCSWEEAVIGKLAHNARLAVLVSFTNEIEGICLQLSLDANPVMATVYTDRRLATNDHLRPGLGPYGGKCVPKDTAELIAGTSSNGVIAAAQTLRNSLLSELVPC